MTQDSHIFISHASEDTKLAKFVADQLTSAGFEPWLDVEQIADGAAWVREIEHGIEQCAAFIVVLTQYARNSQWVERETLMAIKLNKPMFVALFDDVTVPIALINVQYSDFRADQDAAATKLVRIMQARLQTNAAPTGSKQKPSAKPNEDNFFKYIEQLPDGKICERVARDLFKWAENNTDSITFSGRKTPAFQAHIWVGPGGLTVFSVRGYARQPAAEIPLQYLRDFPPYDDRQRRVTVVNALNNLLPSKQQLAQKKADLRPNVPLASVLGDAQAFAAFTTLLQQIVDDVRAAHTPPAATTDDPDEDDGA